MVLEFVCPQKNSPAAIAVRPNSNAANRFRCQATELIEILAPLARSILCLESPQSTLADVMLFWATTCAWYRCLLNDPDFDLDTDTREALVSIVHRRYSEIINDGPHDAYFTSLALHPPECMFSGELIPLIFKSQDIFGATFFANARNPVQHTAG